MLKPSLSASRASGVLQPPSARMLHLDALRLPAAAGIVLFHMLPSADLGAYQEKVISRAQSLALLVDLFFLISGFVIFEVYSGRVGSWRGYRNFMLRRVARLGPLHWLLLAIFAAMPILAASLGYRVNHPEVFAWRCIPENIAFLQATGILCPFRSFNTPAWSISAEMALYVAFPLVAYVTARARFAPLIGAAAALLLLIWTAGDSWTEWMVPGGIWRAIPSFLLGCGLARVKDALPPLRWGGGAAAALVVAFFAGVTAGASPLPLLALLYAAAVCAIMADLDHVGGPVVFTAARGAQLTYSSYMVHLLVINILLSLVAERVLHLTGAGKNIAVLVTFALVWPLSYLSLRFFEHPMREKIGAASHRSASRNLKPYSALR